MKTITALAVLLIASAAQAQFFQYSNLAYSLPLDCYIGTEMNNLYVEFHPTQLFTPATASVTIDFTKPAPLIAYTSYSGTADNPVSFMLYDNDNSCDIMKVLNYVGPTQIVTVPFTSSIGQTFDVSAIGGGAASLSVQITVAVPEPASWLLLAVGAGCCLLMSRRR